MFTWAQETGLPLPVLVRAMAETPARLFGLAHRKGTLAPGTDADLILVDPSKREKVELGTLAPGICPSPLGNAALAGWPSLTLSRGEVVWDGSSVTGKPGRAQHLPQERT